MINIDLNVIAKNVCDYFNIETIDLVRNTRKVEVIKARHFFFYFAHKLSGKSYESIGDYTEKELGRSTPYNHASILHGKRNIESFINLYEDYNEAHISIKEMILSDRSRSIDVKEIDLLKLCKMNTPNLGINLYPCIVGINK